MHVFINKEKFDALPEDLRAIIAVSAKEASLDMLSESFYRNTLAWEKMQKEDKVKIRTFPKDVLAAFKKRFDHRRYNGAALLGLQGLVFKSHGSADVFAFEQALNRAYDAARNNLLQRVRERIAHAAPLLAAQRAAPLADGAAVAD